MERKLGAFMYYFTEENILIFLVQILLLLVVAKGLGELFKRWGAPSLVGEMLTGLLLGPTIFGRLLPAVQQAVFPADAAQQSMLETMSWLGVLFMLLTIGFDVSISRVWRQSGACLKIGIVGVAVPIGLGVAAFWWLPESAYGAIHSRWQCTWLLATAAAISAIPVIAKVLHDLEILKSDFGMTTLSAFIVNDVLGWLLFALILALGSQADADVDTLSKVLFEMVIFATLCLALGSRIVGWIMHKLSHTRMPQPATTHTFIFCLGILCGAITQWIGIHAILGFFLAGVMVGNTPSISDRTRRIISQMVHAIFVPIFFANVGIKVDFFAGFDWLLVGVFTTVALAGKFSGAALGAFWSRMSKAEVLSTGIAHIPGGAMEIIVGVLALELQVISEAAFVAVVFGAILSSLLVGPLLAWSIRRRGGVSVREFFHRDAIHLSLKAEERWAAIDELCRCVAVSAQLDPDELIKAVRDREEIMGTALDGGLAIPHARLPELTQPVIGFGRSDSGVDWDARDGEPTRFVFLILTPESDAAVQVHILGALARAMTESGLREALKSAEVAQEAYQAISAELRKQEINAAL